MKEHRLPLKDVKNFGPVTLAEFEAMGIFYLDEIETLGFEDTCRKWVENFPDRLNANAFLGIACAIDRTIWTKATSTQRALAHNLVEELRNELGLKPRKLKKRSTQKGKR
ncbi:MAG: hypothetical protein KDD50_05440 [Bdellovibrionales bacterium]|nr:hypothetical protein [Bdellovibrionales bacterium]